MQRREALSAIGATAFTPWLSPFSGRSLGELHEPGASQGGAGRVLTAAQLSFITALADTIIPRTDTPGAVEVVGVSYRYPPAHGEREPALVLDDVFAELDDTRQERLALRLAGSGRQLFITAPRRSELPGALDLPCWRMEAGHAEPDGSG